MSFSIGNKHVEALRDPWNLIGLVMGSGVGLCLAAWGVEKKDSGFFLGLLFLMEVFYLWTFPDFAWYRARLRRRYDEKATSDLDWLVRQVFKAPAPDMKKRFQQLKEQRCAIANTAPEDEGTNDTPTGVLSTKDRDHALEKDRRLREIVFGLDCLLEIFLRIAQAAARSCHDLRALFGQVRGQEANATDNWELTEAGMFNPRRLDQAVKAIEEDLDPMISRFETLGQDKDLDKVEKASLTKLLARRAKRRDRARALADALKNQKGLTESLENGFNVVINLVSGSTAGEPEHDAIRDAHDLLKETLNHFQAVTSHLPPLPARRSRNSHRLVAALKWATAQKERRRVVGCLLFGTVVILLFGFGLEKQPHLGKNWELAALIGNLGFGALFYCWVALPQNDVLMRRIPVVKLVPILFFAVLGVSYGTWKALLNNSEEWHIVCLLGLAIAFLLIDALLAMKHNDERLRRDYLGSLLIADIPVVGAVVVLAIYQVIHSHSADEQMSAFMSGAVSFQFISSMVVFAMIQGGVFQKISAVGGASSAVEPPSQTSAPPTEQQGELNAR